jgi:metal-dependent HD superfamily phosphatase/phosphodiesterase
MRERARRPFAHHEMRLHAFSAQSFEQPHAEDRSVAPVMPTINRSGVVFVNSLKITLRNLPRCVPVVVQLLCAKRAGL